jgi:hypothetical protein
MYLQKSFVIPIRLYFESKKGGCYTLFLISKHGIFSKLKFETSAAVPNLFINRVDIVDEKSWGAYYVFENKYMSRIALLKDIKGSISIQIIFRKSPVCFLKSLGERKNDCRL